VRGAFPKGVGTGTNEHEQWSGQEAWAESDRVFTQENGEPYHPD
jgi:hypothetical protein